MLYALDRYLRDRGDANIKTVRDLLAQSTFFDHAPIDGVTLAAEDAARGPARTDRAADAQERQHADGAEAARRQLSTSPAWHAVRTTLQMLVNKVMADNRLDALVYPTKTIPAPLLASPVEPTTLKSVKETVTVTINGEQYDRVVERVVDLRAPLTPRLEPERRIPGRRGACRIHRARSMTARW